MINLFTPSKKTLILIAGLVVLIILITLVSLLTTPTTPGTLTFSPRPLASQTTQNNLPVVSSPPEASSEVSPEPSPETVYSPQVLQQDYDRLNANIPLASNDSGIRTRLIDSLNNQSGFLEQTSNYNIKYIKSRDIFMVEILSADADQAKSEAINWFSSQGLSTEGVCNLPVSIYLNLEVKNTLAGQNQTFNPIPEGCQ